jgi:uroporphyrinogen III methyltransferase/synthase
MKSKHYTDKRKAKASGRVAIVGAGPGRFDLLTLRAIELLRRADIVFHDRLIPAAALQEAAPKAELVYVGKKASYHTLPQDEITRRLIEEAKTGKFVVRLKGGDPFIFGRGGEECEALAKAGILFEVVPGISSAFAAPLFAGIPLTHRRYTPNIAIITGHENPEKSNQLPYQSGVERQASEWVDWAALACMDTIVILMGMGNLRANMDKLMANGKPINTPAAVVRWGGLGKQKSVFATVGTLADVVKKSALKSPAVIVVGGVVELAKDINWFERLPLFGQRVVVTRSPDDNCELVRKLEEIGAAVIEWPSYEYQRVNLKADGKRAIAKIGTYDWLVFTSARAVKFFLKEFYRQHSDVRVLGQAKMAAVGAKTAEAIKAAGLWIDCQPKMATSAGLAKCPEFTRTRGFKILLPQAADARGEFAAAVGHRHQLTSLTVYCKKNRRQSDKAVAELKNKNADWVLFFSPSAVDSFLANFEGEEGITLLKKTRLAVIGQTTAAHVKMLGLAATVVAKRPDVGALVTGLLMSPAD